MFYDGPDQKKIALKKQKNIVYFLFTVNLHFREDFIVEKYVQHYFFY